jgi:cytochrome c-type biogenesis protein CcmH/NrfG
MSTETSMIPGAIALVVGSVSALLVASRITRNASDSETDTPVLDLEEEVGHAVLMLRDLEYHRNRIDPASYLAQKQKLEKEAAQALRERDVQVKVLQEKKETNIMPDEKQGEGFLHNRPQLKGFLWGALVMSVGFGLYFSVSTQAVPRVQGGGMTGAQPAAPMQARPDQAGAPNTEVQELLTKLKENPKDVESMARLGRILLFQQLHTEAKMVTERALQIDPGHTGAQINQAMVAAGQGNATGALTQLSAILERDAKSYDAWFFKGMLSMQTGDNAGMKKSFGQFVALAPESPRKDRIKRMLDGGGMQMPKKISPTGGPK